MILRVFLVLAAMSTAASSFAAERVDFAHDVLPILKARCAQCHTAGKYKGGFSLDTRETILKSKAIVSGNGAKSDLVQRITSKDPEKRMPPKGNPLTATEAGVLRAWIDQGLAWQEGFSFARSNYVPSLKVRRPELPPAHDGRLNPADRIVDAYLEQQKVPVPPRIDEAAFLRRVSLDLVGLLPTTEQRAAFLADTSPDRRDRLIHRLLDDRVAYAEHWLTFWNDLLRNDYAGTGFIDGGRKPISEWLYRALRDNKPYDRFVRELIAPQPEAEGFVKGIKWRGSINASQTTEIQFAQNIAQVFLGINLKCASCHDSFIDGWRLTDAYGLAAVIADGPLELHRCDKPTGTRVQARFLFAELGQIDAGKPKDERLRQLAGLMTQRDNGRLTRTIVNRLWQRLMGRGIVHPVDAMGTEPWSGTLLDHLATHLMDNGYDLQKTMALIAGSEAYRSRTVSSSGEQSVADQVYRGPIARRMTAEQFLDAIWRITGTGPTKPAFAAGERGTESMRAALVVSDPLMRSLGRPNREQVVTTRPEELSTLQALDLTNGRELAELLDKGAKLLRQRHPSWSAHQAAKWLYLSALCREPTAPEMEIARQVLGTPITDEGLSDFLWMVSQLPEFQYIR